jgi:polysaccharide biosynthesis transport protein
VAVLSGDKGEGRSTVAASLALSLGRQGKPVVLVSADLRGGGVEKLFGISRSAAGLAELLESTSTSHAEDNHELSFWSIGSGLFVLPPGQATTSPSELLASRSFHEVLASLRKDEAVVILDTPPARWSADALLAAGAADMNILVVRSGVTGRQAAAELVDGLRAEDLTPACAVLLTKRPIAGRWWRYGKAGDARGGILKDTEIHPASARTIIGTATGNGHDGGRQRSPKRLDG